MNELLNRKPDVFWQSMDAFSRKLNEAPKEEWLKEHNGFKYIPISIIETELSLIFSGGYDITIIDTKIKGNDTMLTARISVFHPVLYEWKTYDGIATAFEDTIAYSEAIKTAAKRIGKRFGSDLNRTDKGDFPEDKGDFSDIKEKVIIELPEDIVLAIGECTTKEQVETLYDSMSDYHKITKFISLILKKKAAIQKAAKPTVNDTKRSKGNSRKDN
jgi:hypothetical protein